MSELDLQALQAIRDSAALKLHAYERAARFRKVREAMIESIVAVSEAPVMDTIAVQHQQAKDSALALEKSLEKLPEKAAQAEAKMEVMLASARRRTRALERWLESLS